MSWQQAGFADHDTLADTNLQFVLMLVFCALTGGLAARKKYSFFAWFMAAGVIGLMVLAFLPKAETPQQRTRGNIIGLAITALCLLLGLLTLHR
jgi:hypothetical protein